MKKIFLLFLFSMSIPVFAGSASTYGNTTYFSDGSSCSKYGNTSYCSDGTSYSTYGNTTSGLSPGFKFTLTILLSKT